MGGHRSPHRHRRHDREGRSREHHDQEHQTHRPRIQELRQLQGPYTPGQRRSSSSANTNHSRPFTTNRVEPEYVSLKVGQTPANPWGLHDVHGLVEEWVHDWYGPYQAGPQTDPVGRVDGEFKVTRGGSHSTQMQTENGWPTYLRSAARAATVPEIRNWVTGFRVVQAEMPGTDPLPAPEPEAIFQDVDQDAHAGDEVDDDESPYFRGPRSFMNLEAEPRGPFFEHNHQPAVTEMPNGDLMAIWYTTEGEEDRVLAQAGARLRNGADEWDDASIFWDAPGRNEHGNELWWDGDETIYHWSGLSAVGTYGALALVQRTSTDNGATWSKPDLIQPEQGLRNQVIAAAVQLSSGRILLPADATPSSGTAVHISDDDGLTWHDPGTQVLGPPPITEQMHNDNAPVFEEGASGRSIAGFHASIAELSDGRLLALGRGDVMGEAPDLPATRSPGKPGFGNALGLGSPEPNSYVDMPEGVLSEVDDFTISLWLNRTSTSDQNWARIFDFGTGKGNTMFLAIEGGGTGPRFTIETKDTSGQQTVTSDAVIGQGWNHLAVTRSGSTVTIYLNGEIVGEGDGVTSSPADLGETDLNWIGRSIYGDPTLNAEIDEFQIYDHALDEAEIGDLLEAPEGSTGGGNVLRYSFDEENGSEVQDASGNDAHGTIDTTFNFNGFMPMSISHDEGETWTYSASEFDPLEGGQRGFLLNLEEEGALMFATFTPRMTFMDSEGGAFTGSGLYTAVSLDDGETWPHRRLVTDDEAPRVLDEGAGRGEFVLSPFSSERFGYLTGTQSKDGRIQLLSSGNHYEFDFDWLTATPPPACSGTVEVGETGTGIDDRRLNGAFRGETTQGGNRHGTWHDACLSHMIGEPGDWADADEFEEHVRDTVADLLDREFIAEEEAHEILNVLDGTEVDGARLIVRATTEGPGAELWGEGPFQAAVTCEAPDGRGAVELDDGGRVTLAADDGYEAEIGGIPAGSSCEVASLESAGATAVTMDPRDGTVEVTDAPEPAAVEIAYTFETTSLGIEKIIDGEAGGDGPFTFELACTRPGIDGPESIVIPDGSSRQVSGADSLSVSYDQLPPAASCVLSEVDAGGADHTRIDVMDGDDIVASHDAAEAAIELPSAPTETLRVIVTNVFDADATPPSPDSSEQVETPGELPDTGAPVLPLIVGTGLLIAAGVWIRVCRVRAAMTS
ncbi:SUMF1/EgtB/PvdO family nonheme iron enzyme [Pseudactinotalea sp. HY158]|nr:SUMF1/EgtB/PvdO family nonheme iron enzyme [Pseudactinotalea sp. HY158]